MRIIGRVEERDILERVWQSQKPEFLALYGRRRVGKTFLIRNFFESKKNTVFMNVTGAKDAPLREQIDHFFEVIGMVFFNGITPKGGKNWDKTFRILTDTIGTVSKHKKVVLFFDEFPWMATKNSRLLQNLDYYWNQYWSQNPRIKLIICGSSSSWILDRIINNKAGLYNRVTQVIHLEPLNLRDAKKFLYQIGVKLNNRQIAQLYMVVGGVPYYLSKIEKNLSAMQAIERIGFGKQSFLLNEFNELFASLFGEDVYMDIMRMIAQNRYGVSQEELLTKIDDISKGIGGLSKLQALEKADFIKSFKPHFHKKRGLYYRIIDEYTLFYFKWIEPIKETLLKTGLRKGYWDKIQMTQAWHSWSGYAFEMICYKHLAQLGEALHLSPTAIPNTWRYSPSKGSPERGAQIDLLFDRDDGAITICEIKYTKEPFVIDKQYAANLLNKIEVFKKITQTSKQVFLAIISANGMKPTMYSEEIVSDIVALDDLFKG